MIIPEIEPNIDFFPFLENNKGFEAWDMLDLVFTHFKLIEIRQSLWDWYKAALQDASINSSSKDRSNLVFFLECMNDMATAAYVVARQKYLQEQAEENNNPSTENKSATDADTNI